MSTTVRELKLLPEFAHLYPGLTANVWIRGTVLAQWLSSRGSDEAWDAGDRPLASDRHFAFRKAALPELAS
jgi:hypothetical protein